MALNDRLRQLKSRYGTLLRYSSASALNHFTGMMSGLIIIAWIPPGELGIWKALLIIQAYAGIVQGGIVQGLNRELPFRIGGGDRASVHHLAATAQTFTVAGCALLLLAGIASLFVSPDPMIRFALPVVFLVVATGIYVNYLSVTFRADQEFEMLAKINLVIASANLVTLPMVYAMGYYGLPLRVLSLGLLSVLLLHLRRPFRVPLRFRMADFLTLMKVGVPLFVVGYALQLSLTFPNTILLFTEGVEKVGLFAPALAIYAMMTLVPASISQYVYAKMSFRLGQSGDLQALWRQAWQSSLGVLLVSAPLSLGVVLFFPYFVRAFFPKYTEAIPAAGWIAVAGAFYGAQLFSSAMNSMKAWRWIYAYTTVRVALAFVVPFAAFHFLVWDPLSAVAAGYATAGALTFAIGLAATFKATHTSGTLHLKSGVL